MLRLLRPRITYANVVSTLALFLVVAGGSAAYAVSHKIDGSQLRKGSVTSRQIKPNSLGRKAIKESSLRRVPLARNAELLGGQPPSRFLVGCQPGSVAVAGVCMETQAHPPAPYRQAAFDCSLIDNQERAGRRLPTHEELMVALSRPDIGLAPGGELTSEVYPSSSNPGKVDVLYITDEGGSVALAPDNGDGAKSFRCVSTPMN